MTSAVASSSAIADMAQKEKDRGEGTEQHAGDVLTFHMLQVVTLGSFGGFLLGCGHPLSCPCCLLGR
jgi:hypothetical protein